MAPPVTLARMIELVAALALLAAGVFLYRRKPASGDPGASGYGNQGAVILLVVAAIMAIHALGGLDYHPTAAEADLLRSRAQ